MSQVGKAAFMKLPAVTILTNRTNLPTYIQTKFSPGIVGVHCEDLGGRICGVFS